MTTKQMKGEFGINRELEMEKNIFLFEMFVLTKSHLLTRNPVKKAPNHKGWTTELKKKKNQFMQNSALMARNNKKRTQSMLLNKEK